ncbi:MAG: ABC transporter permease [Gammaproteobacteria bacterium]|nr:ABC transporter permease [Gammaproteobacteria bacterium]MCP5136795.1 ABC transporter permease [Gammaproteobacteria bacterium]
MPELPLILQLALRNLWRNPRRTLTALASLMFATGVVTFLGAMNDGWLHGMRDNFILTFSGHWQVHGPRPMAVDRLDPRLIRAISPRTERDGLGSVGAAATGVRIVAIDPLHELAVSRLGSYQIDGHCLGELGEREVVLGRDVARTLNARMGSHVVLTAEGRSGELVSELFTVCAQLQTGAPQIDRRFAVIPLATARQWLGAEAEYQAIRMRPGAAPIEVETHLRAQLPPDSTLLGWAEIDPMVHQWLRFGEVYGLLVLGIVIALTVAQVSNTMILALYERVREFGLMEALGTRRGQLFALVSTEAAILVVAGGFGGWLLGALAVASSGAGIDFSTVSGAFRFFFMDPVIRPELTGWMAFKVGLALAVSALLGGLYPAWVAARLDPVEAMRWH